MPPFDYIVMPAVLLFAGIAAWGDLKPMLPHLLGRTGYTGAVHGRISNRVLLYWLVFGVLALIGGLVFEALGGTYQAAQWVLETEGISLVWAVLINAGLAFLLAIALWLLGLWAAGDAKMFALLAFTLPLSMYHQNYLSFFPSFALFFNTFIAMFLLLLVEFSIQTVFVAGRTRGAFFIEKGLDLWKKFRDNKMLALKVTVFFLALFTFVRIGRHFIREGLEQYIELNKTIIYVLLFLMFRPLMRLAEKRWAFMAALGVIAGYAVYAFWFDPTGQAKYEFVNIGWLAASIIIFRLAYDSYLKATDEQELSWKELRRGMILGDTTLEKFKERKQFFKEKVGEIAPDGLTEEQVEAMCEWYSTNAPDGTVTVSRTIPLAPALFVGAVLTVIAQGLVLVF